MITIDYKQLFNSRHHPVFVWAAFGHNDIKQMLFDGNVKFFCRCCGNSVIVTQRCVYDKIATSRFGFHVKCKIIERVSRKLYRIQRCDANVRNVTCRKCSSSLGVFYIHTDTIHFTWTDKLGVSVV